MILPFFLYLFKFRVYEKSFILGTKPSQPSYRDIINIQLDIF